LLDSIATTVVVKFSWLANFNLFNVGSSVMVMGDFPVGKCQVVWQKDATSEAERQAILRELRQMAVELQEAIDFTIKLSNKKSNEVKYWFETELETDFTLSIYYDAHAQAWGMLIEKMPTENTPPKVVGEIACKDPMTFRFIEEENILKTEPLTNK
jgi:hypothetical protein